jgi:hypothetical protein
MTGSFRNIGIKIPKHPSTDWIYQGQVKGFKAFGIGRIVGSDIGIIEGQFDQGPNGWGSWMDPRTN